jgi:chemotaxis protein methyltransferase CheR
MMGIQKLNNFLTDKDFRDYVSLIKTVTGINFKLDKKNLIEYRLGKRLFDKGLDPQQYLQLVINSDEEMKFFINQMTTHKTEWFREEEHFEFLANQFAEKKDPIYIWSAACSTGEEPYSIMMTLGEMGFSYNQQRILGTDISSICVNQARQAMYPLAAVEEALPPDLLNKYFIHSSNGSSRHSSYAIVNPLWAENAIKFKELNLTDFTLPQGVSFDVIFLRNVLIYFEVAEALKILKNLIRYLRPKGFLILGLTEPIQHPQNLGLKRVTKSVYTHE